MAKPFELKGSRELLRTPIFRLREDQATHPVTARLGTYYVLECPDWVNVIPLTEKDEVVLVRQWRHGIRKPELEIPAGLMEAGEEPVVTAARELREETGYVAGSAKLLGWVHPNSAFQDNRCWSVLAEGCRLEAERHLDPGEDIEVVLVPRAKLPELLRSGELRSAMGLCAILWWLDTHARAQW